MWSSLIKIYAIGTQNASKLLLPEDQEMIQAFSPHAAQKAFANGIGLRGPIRGSKDPDAACCGHSCKVLPECAIIIPDQTGWGLPIWRRLAQLLCDPGISWRARHVHVDHLPRLQEGVEEGKERTKEEIGHL